MSEKLKVKIEKPLSFPRRRESRQAMVIAFSKLAWIPTFVGMTLLLIATTANAEKLGGQAGAFLRVGLGADRVAMGDAGVALSGAGMNWYYNPAGIPFHNTRQASLGYRMMSLDRSMMYAGYSMPLQGNAGLALGVVRAAVDDIDARDSNGRRFDMLTYSDNLIHGSFSLRPHPKFGIGISLKWMISAAPDVLSGDKNLYAYGMGIDLGIQIRPTDALRFGLQARDVNSKMSWDASDVWGDGRGQKDDELPGMLRVGAAYDANDDLTIAADALINTSEVGNSSDAISPKFGVEWRIGQFEEQLAAIRGGWNGESPSFGLGLGMKLRWGVVAKMDYAYVVDNVSPGGSHLVGWTFGF